MSLIADELKAPQKEKARRSPPPRTPQQQGYFPFRFPTRGSGEPIVSPLVIGIGVATAAIALTALVLVFSPSRKPGTTPPAIAQFPDSVPTTLVLDTLGDSGQLALLDTTVDDPSERIDVDDYIDEPPRRAVARAPSGGNRSTSRQDPDDNGSDEPLPSIVSSPPTRSVNAPAGRLQITVDQPIQSSEGSGLFELGLGAQRRGDYIAAKGYYLQATFTSPRNPEL